MVNVRRKSLRSGRNRLCGMIRGLPKLISRMEEYDAELVFWLRIAGRCLTVTRCREQDTQHCAHPNSKIVPIPSAGRG